MWKQIGLVMWKQIGLVVFTFWLPVNGFGSGLSAEQTSQPLPTIEGTLEGESREWYVLRDGNDSTASFVEFGDDINIDITGFIDAESREAQEALSISLTARDGQLISSDVIHLIGESTSPPLYTSEGADLTVLLTHYERGSQTVHVAGKIQGVLALQMHLDEPPSQNEGIEIDVEFDAEAQKIEF